MLSSTCRAGGDVMLTGEHNFVFGLYQFLKFNFGLAWQSKETDHNEKFMVSCSWIIVVMPNSHIDSL